MTSLPDLIARVEKASGSNSALDCEIAEAIGIRSRSRRTRGGVNKGREWFVDSHGGVETWAHHPPAFTASLDVAMSLVPEGCVFTVAQDFTGCKGYVNAAGPWRTIGNSRAATPALALLAAALRCWKAE